MQNVGFLFRFYPLASLLVLKHLSTSRDKFSPSAAACELINQRPRRIERNAREGEWKGGTLVIFAANVCRVARVVCFWLIAIHCSVVGGRTRYSNDTADDELYGSYCTTYVVRFSLRLSVPEAPGAVVGNTVVNSRRSKRERGDRPAKPGVALRRQVSGARVALWPSPMFFSGNLPGGEDKACGLPKRKMYSRMGNWPRHAPTCGQSSHNRCAGHRHVHADAQYNNRCEAHGGAAAGHLYQHAHDGISPYNEDGSVPSLVSCVCAQTR